MRVLAFCILILLAYLAPIWVLCIAAVAYALWRPAYELIVLGMFIDAQFGVTSESMLYLYTLVLGGIVLVAEVLKPHLSFYNESL